MRPENIALIAPGDDALRPADVYGEDVANDDDMAQPMDESAVPEAEQGRRFVKDNCGPPPEG